MNQIKCPHCRRWFTHDHQDVDRGRMVHAERVLRDAIRFRRRAYAISVAIATFTIYLMWGSSKAAQAFFVIGGALFIGAVAAVYHDIVDSTVVEARDRLEDARVKWAEKMLEEDAA